MRRRLHMDRGDLLFVAGVFVSVFLPMIIVFVGSGKQWRAAEEKAHARRRAEYRISARLLRLDI